MQILDACILVTFTAYIALFAFFMLNIDEIW